MKYLYHKVPKDMVGEILYPLNQLDKKSDTYKNAIKKYEGREFITRQPIPPLNCLWNDTIHLSAIHPQDIMDELKKRKVNVESKSFFQIEPKILEPEKTTIYLYKQNIEKDKFLPENWTEYNPNKIEEYSKITTKTIDYYNKMISEGRKLLWWAYIPHIMYKGSINISNTKIITTK